MKINVTSEMDTEVIAENISYLEAVALVKHVDRYQQDGDFTFDMAAWFIREVIKFDEDKTYVQALKNIFKEDK